MTNRKGVWVPEILKIGTRGVRAKIWALLYINEGRWLTAKEIAHYLEMPLSTVQISLKQVLRFAPRIQSIDLDRTSKGRPEKAYRFVKRA